MPATPPSTEEVIPRKTLVDGVDGNEWWPISTQESVALGSITESELASGSEEPPPPLLPMDNKGSSSSNR